MRLWNRGEHPPCVRSACHLERTDEIHDPLKRAEAPDRETPPYRRMPDESGSTTAGHLFIG
jgi:hypothetical protein